jgi:hypothetical protein
LATNTLSDVSIRKVITPDTQVSFRGVEKVLALGAYPEISLKQARLKRDDARALLDQNIDPSERRRAERLARFPSHTAHSTFNAIAEEWFKHYCEHKKLEANHWHRRRSSGPSGY